MTTVTIAWEDPRLPARFWDKTRVNARTGCWEWTQPLDRDGYGQWFHVTGSGADRVRERPHRHAYTVLVGPIDNETLNHDCHVRHCVNPNTGHAATPMSNADNVREGKSRITHCPRGHEYTDVNTMRVGPRKDRRQCRTCANDRSRSYWYTTRKNDQKAERRGRGYRGGVSETTTCRHGHERTPENTYTSPQGYRSCKVCRNRRSTAANQRVRHPVGDRFSESSACAVALA